MDHEKYPKKERRENKQGRWDVSGGPVLMAVEVKFAFNSSAENAYRHICNVVNIFPQNAA
jgi:hypothetical protein